MAKRSKAQLNARIRLAPNPPKQRSLRYIFCKSKLTRATNGQPTIYINGMRLYGDAAVIAYVRG